MCRHMRIEVRVQRCTTFLAKTLSERRILKKPADQVGKGLVVALGREQCRSSVLNLKAVEPS